jgi:hypothetical protein
VHRSKIVHELIDEFGDSYFSKVAMSLVADQPHREDIAERRRNQFGMLADKQRESSCEIFVRCCGIH